MSKAQDKYLHRKPAETEPEAKSELPLTEVNAPSVHLSSDPALAAGSLKSLDSAVQSIEVLAGRVESMVAAKSNEQTATTSNRAQVAPRYEGSSMQATLEWLAHRLNTANDRLTAGLNTLDGL